MEASTYPKFYMYSRVVKAKLFIDEHYAEEIELDNISDEACFSKYHFIRLFRKVYGSTPRQYLIRVRLEKAVALLKAGKSVAAVCYEVGLESPGSFSTLFKGKTGLPPATFRAVQEHIRAQVAAKPLDYIPGCYIYQYGLAENSNFEEIE